MVNVCWRKTNGVQRSHRFAKNLSFIYRTQWATGSEVSLVPNEPRTATSLLAQT